MGVKQKLKTYRKAKSAFKSEKEAVEQVMKESGLAETNLQADHTEKQYRWKQIR